MTQAGGYDARATARWASEPPKRARNPGRGPFERDRARVLHSAALRRLAAKTQVVEVGSGDFPRTRLTHSLECAQIGREFGAVLGCDPDLVDAACLAHDLGHPPFGHNGESALAEYAVACGGFEGNAQSLRLLTRLEAKVPGAGLNLTRATLDATLKYPWPARPGEVKFGVYADDAEAFAWIRDGAPPRKLCLEAQVMDWSDDVAYSVHDLEDGLQAGLITLKALRDPSEQRAVALLTAAEYCAPESVALEELCEVFTGLITLPCWPAGFDGGLDSLAALKNLTSELIGRFCRSAQDATLASGSAASQPLSASGSGASGSGASGSGASQSAAGRGRLTRYAADLVVPRRQRLECALLKGVTMRYVMSRAGAAASQARERELIAELAAAVESGAPATLDPVFRPGWDTAGTDTARRRVVVDQIASLSDTSANAWHRRLCR
ncbi:MAG TPA: deoxyguanosinetriphosphate triphosphohydrolase [Streptosporangiaceae bacterium]|nr:deoxyguanosinetriphosphate triphosphohydrolase [Streptosporangiaceae bacterium]